MLVTFHLGREDKEVVIVALIVLAELNGRACVAKSDIVLAFYSMMQQEINKHASAFFFSNCKLAVHSRPLLEHIFP